MTRSRHGAAPDIPVEKLTLREAAGRTGLSITTLRRYVRSGRLAAEKTPGRFGPEYTVSMPALEQAGARAAVRLGTDGALGRARSRSEPVKEGAARDGNLSPSLPAISTRSLALEVLLRELIPIDLFRELSMKHEQLLVQYGMVRVGGQRMMEYKIEAEKLADSLRRTEESARVERERYAVELGDLERHLRETDLEIEGKNQQIEALQERVRILEVLSRNAITTESIEHQFLQVFDKRREIEELSTASSDERRRKLAAFDELLRAGFRQHPDRETSDQ